MTVLQEVLLISAVLFAWKAAAWIAWFGIRIGHQQLHAEAMEDYCEEEAPKEAAIGFRMEQDPDDEEEDDD